MDSQIENSLKDLSEHKISVVSLESVHFSDEIFLPNIFALLILSSVVKGQKCWGEISRR